MPYDKAASLDVLEHYAKGDRVTDLISQADKVAEVVADFKRVGEQCYKELSDCHRELYTSIPYSLSRNLLVAEKKWESVPRTIKRLQTTADDYRVQQLLSKKSKNSEDLKELEYYTEDLITAHNDIRADFDHFSKATDEVVAEMEQTEFPRCPEQNVGPISFMGYLFQWKGLMIMVLFIFSAMFLLCMLFGGGKARLIVNTTESKRYDTNSAMKTTESNVNDTNSAMKTTESNVNDTNSTMKTTESPIHTTTTTSMSTTNAPGFTDDEICYCAVFALFVCFSVLLFGFLWYKYRKAFFRMSYEDLERSSTEGQQSSGIYRQGPSTKFTEREDRFEEARRVFKELGESQEIKSFDTALSKERQILVELKEELFT